MSYTWQATLEEALKKNRRDAPHRYLQLASLDSDGYPANRTVVFRGFSEGGELMVVTDRRSAKIEQLRHDARVEACWYFTRTREQFRIRGRVTLVEAGAARSDERDAAWDKLSEAAREQFFWPTPGQPVDPAGGSPVSEVSPQDFVLLLLAPERVDYLCLRSPQQRYLSVLEGSGWQSEAVNP